MDADDAGVAGVAEDTEDTEAREDDERAGDLAERLAPRSGDSLSYLVFDVSPKDAVVYVDDRFAGIAAELNSLEDGLPVPPGEHEVTVARAGFREITVTIQTRARKEARVDVELTDPEPAAPTGRPDSI